MQIPAAEVARDLREWISAHISAIVGDVLGFSMFCVAFVWTCFDTARFPDNSRFFRLAYLWVSFIKTCFPFFDEKCALRTCGVFMAFCDFRTQN